MIARCALCHKLSKLHMLAWLSVLGVLDMLPAKPMRGLQATVLLFAGPECVVMHQCHKLPEVVHVREVFSIEQLHLDRSGCALAYKCDFCGMCFVRDSESVVRHPHVRLVILPPMYMPVNNWHCKARRKPCK